MFKKIQKSFEKSFTQNNVIARTGQRWVGGEKEAKRFIEEMVDENTRNQMICCRLML